MKELLHLFHILCGIRIVYSASRTVWNLPPVYKYHYIDELSTFIRHAKYMQFDIKGCNDAHFILSEHRNDSSSSYEILVGGWANSGSVIRKCKNCASVASVSHSPMSCTEFRPIWVSWGNGIIRAGEGREVNTGTFIEWSVETSHPVNFLGISSWNTITSWRYFIGNVSSLEAAPGESNVIKLESGKSVVVKLTFEAPENTSYEFSATLDNGIAINTSSATIDNGTIVYVIYSHFMSGVSFGSYLVIFSMVDNMNSVAAKEKEMFLQYEERITGFTILTNNTIFLWNREGSVEVSMSSGSNVVTEWSWSPSQFVIHSLQCNGSSAFSANFTYTNTSEGSQFNVSVTAFNNFSNATAHFAVSLYNGINGVSINCSSKVELNRTTIVVLKMSSTEIPPDGLLRANLSYGNNDEDEHLDLYTRLSELTSSGVNITKAFDTLGNHSVMSHFYTEFDEQILTCSILVCENLTAVLKFDKVQKRNETTTFYFVNKTIFDFDFVVDFGDGTVLKNSDVNPNDPYSVTTINKTYTTFGEYNITYTICTACLCTVASDLINVLDGISFFDVATGQNDFVKLESRGNAVVSLVYDTKDTNYSLTLTAWIKGGLSLDVSTASIDRSDETVTYNLTYALVDSLSYGTYELVMSLMQTISDYNDTMTKTLVLFYEEPITITKLTVLPAFVVDEPALINLTFDGSNVITEWLLDGTDYCIINHTGFGERNVTLNLTITKGGPINVTVIVSNSIHRKSVSVETHALYRINGISFSVLNPVIDTLQGAVFNVTLESNSLQPQGTTDLTINFDDGSSEEKHFIYNETSLVTMQISGFSVAHNFTKQGNFSVVAILHTEVDTKHFVTNVYVWDNLENVEFISSKMFAKVNETIYLSFPNPPYSNFHYIITYGDDARTENISTDLQERYSLISPLSKSYNSPEKYSVTATMFNSFYIKVVTLVIKVEIPITPDAFTLSPEKEVIPIPDGVQRFILQYNSSEPVPTDMLCTFDFEDDGFLSVFSELSDDKSIVETHNYTSEGVFNVYLNCSNHVSEMNKSSTIVVQSFNLSDFKVFYGDVVKVMNMTTEAVKPNETYRHNSKPVVQATDVSFYISLKNCSRMPPGIWIKWDFGDGTIEYGYQRSFSKTHTFKKKGNYSMTFSFNDTETNEEHLFFYELKMGVVDFYIDKPVGLVAGNTLIFHATGMNNATYTFDSDSSKATMVPIDSHSTNVTYNEYGTFLPKVTAKNAIMTEVVYYTDIIKADFSLENIISITVPNKSVLLPPGTVNISIVSKMPLPFVTCMFISGDFIDKKIHTKTANITPSEPMVIPYTYLTLGDHSLKMNCSNYYETITLNDFILHLYNPCFSPHGIFDRNYALYDRPLKAYTSKDLFVSSRMHVICIDKTANFEWEYFRCLNRTNKTIFNYTSSLNPLQGSNVFTRGSVPPGTYEVTLNISLEETWLKEKMFIEFIKPAPYAFIIGGRMRAAKSRQKIIEIDASSGSYDGAKGYGENKNLTYIFNCRMFSTNDYRQIESAYANQSSSGYCNMTSQQGNTAVLDRGKRYLDVTTADGYAVTVNVSDGQKSTYFTQLIRMLDGDPPDMLLNCSMNCAEKYAVTSKMNLYAVCLDCQPDEVPIFSWRLYKLVGEKEEEEEVENFINMTATGIDSATMVLKENSLEPGQRYLLKLETSLDNRDGTTNVAMDIRTNYPPHYGDCKVVPEEGQAMKTTFDIVCNNWLDEGSRLERNFDIDAEEQEPLTYLYEVVSKSNASGTVIETKTALYTGAIIHSKSYSLLVVYPVNKIVPCSLNRLIIVDGNIPGESSAINMQLPLGNKDFNYTLDIHVYVFDKYGDYNSTTAQVKVKPVENFIPTDDKDTKALDELFDSFSGLFNITASGGNDMAVVRLVGSVLSYFKESSQDVIEQTEEDEDNGDDDENEDESLSPVTGRYQKEAVKIAGVLLNTVTSGNNTKPKVFSPADGQQMSRTLMSVTKNPDFITTDSAENITEVATTIMASILENANILPFPVESIATIAGAIDNTLSSLDQITDTLLPDEVYDPTEIVTEDSIYQNLLKEYERDVDFRKNTSRKDLWRRAKKKYKEVQKARNKQKGKEDFAKKTAKSIRKTLEDIEKAMIVQQEVGEGSKSVIGKGIKVTTEVGTLGNIVNKSQPLYQGVQVDFVEASSSFNDTLLLEPTSVPTSTQIPVITSNVLNVSSLNDSNPDANTIVQIKMSVTAKNPLMYGNNSKLLTSSIASVNLEGNIAPTIKFKSKLPAYRYMQRYTPKTFPEDPDGFMYLRIYVKSKEDTLIAYLNPEDLSSGNDNLYTIYLGKTNYPRQSKGKYVWKRRLSVRDLTKDGFKFIIPPNICDEGVCYLGIKPMKDVANVNETRSSRKRRATQDHTNSSIHSTIPSIEDSVKTSQNNSIFDSSSSNFAFAVATTGCRTWDEEEQDWVSTGCQVLESSTLEETNCRCTKTKSRGSIFATTFYVPPNTIDFDNIQIDLENAAVYGTLIGIFSVTIVCMIILRKKDIKDLEKWSIYFLADSEATDRYFYLITVQTGFRRGSGTKSNVCFVLSGEDDDTGVRLLTDGITEGFETSSIKRFFMGTSACLGDLTYLRIWHDSAGSGDLQSWYLDKVIIDDVQTRNRYTFLCEQWLALDHDDGKIERIIPECGQKHDFKILFSQHIQKSLTDNHLWLSIIIRPERSNFTRVQRLACLVTFLILTMLTNAMFFKSTEDIQPADEVRIGFIRFSMTNLIVSIQSILITTPPIIFVVLIFRKSRPKFASKPNETMTEKSLNKRLSKLIKDKSCSINEKDSLDDAVVQNRLPFPYWTIYIAWSINFLSIVGSTFYLFLISMEWGKSKSEEWITTFILSFLESFFVVDPVKITLLAFILALLFKKSPDGDCPSVSIEKLQKSISTYKSEVQRADIVFIQDLMKPDQEAIKEDIRKLKAQREQELYAKDALYTLLFYAIFMFVIYSVSYIERDQRSYHLKQNIYQQLFGNNTLSKITNTSEFYRWMRYAFIPMYYPLKNYADQELTSVDKQWFGDMANIRVGPGRIRQVRMNKGTEKAQCDYEKLTGTHLCYEKYNEFEEDESEYCLGWKPYNPTVCDSEDYKLEKFTASAWKFTKSADIWGSSMMGEYTVYGGGGFIVKFTQNRETAIKMLYEIEQNNWIDRGTRAIIVEFTLYNGNIHMFTYVNLFVETTETGGVFLWVEIRPFRPFDSLNVIGTYPVLCYILFIIYQIVLTIQTSKHIRKKGVSSFIKSAWNVVDTVCLLLGYFAIGAFITRMIYTNTAMDMFYDDLGTIGEDSFVNFNHIVIWDQTYTTVVALLVFIATLRIIKILGYNRKFTEIVSVITTASTELLSFGIVFALVFFAFVFSGSLLFGKNLEEYRDLFHAWATLTNTLIGKNSLRGMAIVSPYIAKIYYFVYVFFVLFTLITVFAAVLNSSITSVRKETASVGEIFGIFDMLKKTLKGLVGVVYRGKSGQGYEKSNKHLSSDVSVSSKIDTPTILRILKGAFNNTETLQDLKVKITGKDSKDMHPVCSKKGHILHSDDTLRISSDTERLTGVNTPRDIELLLNYSS